ncbi:MAG: hypothetical protein ACYCW6_13275 [Candidatus Xenobia bacterium]
MLVSSVARPVPLQPQQGPGPIEKAVSALDDHPVLHDVAHDAVGLGTVLHAFPQFIYPTITGATASEKAFILQTLNNLPLKDVASVNSIEMVPHLANASGVAIPENVTNVVQLARDQTSLSPQWFQWTLTHEIGHAKDFASRWFGLFGGDSTTNGEFNHGPYITDYAHTSVAENYAESYAQYHVDPSRLQHVAPAKYAIINSQEHQNILEQAIDNHAFRATGEWIGQNVLSNQVVRTGAQALYWVGGALQLGLGLEQLHLAAKDNDPDKHMQGILNVASGTLISTHVLAAGGLVIQGARRALVSGIKRGDITGADADAVVRKVSDPVERGVRFVGSKVHLTAPFEPLPTRPDPHLKEFRAAAIGIGGSAGAVVGGLAGPYAGVTAGYAVGGPVGGAIGLVTGALVGYIGGSYAGGRLGSAVAHAVGK